MSVAETESKDVNNVFKFSNDGEMKYFIELIQGKQAIVNKIAVLENYRAIEQSNSDQINGQLLLKYKIDPSKNYALDTKKNQLLESENANDTNGIVIYSFQSEDDLKAFAQLIQLKQTILNRIAVVQNYQLAERANLENVSGQLMLKYRIDPNKNYNLDPEKKIIFEVKQEAKQQENK